MNIAQILHQAASRFPARIAVVDAGHDTSERRPWTYAELDACARRGAALLLDAGIAPGSTIALIGENSAHFVSAWFAIAYAGCTVVPIPILSSEPELHFRIQHAGCRAVLCDAARHALVRACLTQHSSALPCFDLAELARGSARELPRPQSAGSDSAMILYTSGTSGQAKGAAISHASLLLHTGLLAQRSLGLSENDHVLGVLPLSHSFGCRTAMLVSFFVGARCVLLPRFDAARSRALMHDEAISFVPAVPTMFAAWAALPDGPAPPALRWALCAGAPLADATALRAERALGVEVRQAYGMTEATICTVNAPPDLRVLGSVGQPVWGIELRLLDAAGNDVPQGQSGEVAVRGHNAMRHYLHDPEATQAALVAGFFRSGDVGRCDEAGRLFIVDRIKDLIIRGGYNVYPSEIEAELLQHPDVAHAAVIGRPHDYYGEEVLAVVVPRSQATLDEAELLGWAAQRLGRNKRPRELAFVDALPLGPSGKVLKRELRQWLHEGRLRVISPAGPPSEGTR